MIDGLVVVDKEVQMTSHDVVDRCRRIFAQRRVGHAGTLDPDATGVLLVGLGRATRLLRFLTPLDKRYVGEVVLGVATTTLDASGDVTGRWDCSSVTLAQVREAAAGLTGSIAQVPPMVSAVRIGGKRLYQLAREGREVERPARAVDIHSLRVEPSDEAGVFTIDVCCSSGTFVRSLAADLGTAVGAGAHLRGLRRLAVGPFTVDMATTLAELGPADVLTPAVAVGHLASVQVGEQVAARVAHGAVLDGLALGIGPLPGGLPQPARLPGGPPQPARLPGGAWAVLDAGGVLLAVYEQAGADRYRPAVVLAPAPGGDPA